MALFYLRNSKYWPSFHTTNGNWVSVFNAHLTQDQSGFVKEVSHVEMTSSPHAVPLT